MTSDVLLVGCGDLGSAVGLRLAELGHDVLALRRNADKVPAPLRGLSVDLTRETPTLDDLEARFLVVALTARPRTEEAYRSTYVEGMRRALDALAATGSRPERAVLVSSTAVHPSARPPGARRRDDARATERRTGPDAAGGRGALPRTPAPGTVLRLSGLYGGSSTRLLDQVREGRIDDPHRWTNRIHREDAAAAVVHLLTMPEQPEPLYLGTDDEPAQLGEVAAFLAGDSTPRRHRRPTPSRATASGSRTPA